MNRYEWLEKVVRDYKPQGPVLEIGAGNENSTQLTIKSTPYDKMDLGPGPDINIVGDICNSTIPSSSYQTTVCMDTLEHVTYPIKAVCEMGRILRPGGLLILVSVSKWVEHQHPKDYWRFLPDSFELMFKDADLQTIKIEQEKEGEAMHGIHIYGLAKKG